MMSKEETSKAFNQVIANPNARLQFLKELIEMLGPLLMYEPVALEQLVTTIEKDLAKPCNLPPVLFTLDKMGRDMARQEVVTLKAFLIARPIIVEYLKKNGAERTELIPV